MNNIRIDVKRKIEEECEIQRDNKKNKKNNIELVYPILRQEPIPIQPFNHYIEVIDPNPIDNQNNKIESILYSLNKMSNDFNVIINKKITVNILPICHKFVVLSNDQTPLNFVPFITELFKTIAQKNCGMKLLTEINKLNHYIFIEYSPIKNETINTRDSFVAEKGSGSLILFKGDSPFVFNHHAEKVPSPPFIVLAHELIHALHAGRGERRVNTHTLNQSLWGEDEEYATIMDREISENLIRLEHNLPIRYSHQVYSEDKNIQNAILEEVGLKKIVLQLISLTKEKLLNTNK